MSGVVLVLAGIVGQLPLVIALLVGVVMAIRRRAQNPRAATFALIAAVVGLLAEALVIMVVVSSSLLPEIVASAHVPVALVGVVYRVVGIFVSLLAAIPWILITIALFGRSKPAQALPPVTG
ncbi:hypothetical protein GCM10009765_01260 [Fodinicola feengrottensis]|uniref:Uncharacterized protein n=1 Tax=Fodinicola feengrottensis TaxID=435914 RepID=A0ABN2FQ66_9ACTN